MNGYVNGIGIIIALTSLVMLRLARGAFHAESIFTLLVGLFFVALAADSFHMLQGSELIINILRNKHKITPSDYETAKNNIALWEYAAPVAILAVGANLITAWFLAKDPKR